MKYIVLIAVLGVLLLQASGEVPQSSVGGPMTIALAFFVAALAVGIHEAWTNKRGVLGWIVNIVVSFVAAFLSAEIGSAAMVPILMVMRVFVHMDGSLVATGGPLLYVFLAFMMVAILMGTWGALWALNRLASRRPLMGS